MKFFRGSFLKRFKVAFFVTTALFFICYCQPAKARTDSNVADRIEEELKSDMAVPSFRINVASHDGVVTLSGTVNNLLARERAGRIAEAISNVRSVVNTIGVTPFPFRNDPATGTEGFQDRIAMPPSSVPPGTASGGQNRVQTRFHSFELRHRME